MASDVRELAPALSDAREATAAYKRSEPSRTARALIGRVLSERRDRGIAGLHVHGLLLRKGEQPQRFDTAITGVRGQFALTIAGPPRTEAGEEPPISVRCRVLSADGTFLVEQDIELCPGALQQIEIRAPAPASSPVPSHRLTSLTEATGRSLPADLVAHLRERGIDTLEDLRRADFSEPPSRLSAESEGVLADLSAHALLVFVSEDVRLNQTLISKGYRSPVEIAKAPRSIFVTVLSEQLDVAQAEALHERARAQVRVLDNAMTRLRTDAAYARETARVAKSPLDIGESTGPEQSALGPLAYFSDLSDFTLERVRTSQDETLTLEDLGEYLHQPFDKLLVSPAWVSREVRQLRLVVETLLGYAHSNSQLPPEGKAARQAYLRAAYDTLVRELGTSLEELRTLPPPPVPPEGEASDAKLRRETLAERLDIGVQYLDRMAQGAKQNDALTDRYLHEVFGFQDASSDALSVGVKLVDSKNQLTQWAFEGLLWSRNTDAAGKLWGRVAGPPGEPTVSVDIYRDSATTQLVARGLPTSRSVTLEQVNASGLKGRLEFNIPPTGGHFCIAGVPEVLCWRLERQRRRWSQEDWPAPAYALDRLPVVDPDLLCRGEEGNLRQNDFREPWSANPASTLYGDRKAVLSQDFAEFEQDLGAPNLAGIIASILQKVFGDPLPPFDAWLTALEEGSAIEVVQAELEQLALSVDSFRRMMTLRSAAVEDNLLEERQRGELASILTQCKKVTQYYPEWRTEESEQEVALGPRYFWLSLEEPKLQRWRGDSRLRSRWQQQLKARSAAPLLDPDVVAAAELASWLPAPTTVDALASLWTSRVAWLEQHRPGGPGNVYDKDVSRMLSELLGVDDSGWQAIVEARAAGDDVGPKLQQLGLTFPAYERVTYIQRCIEAGAQVDDRDWQDVYDIVLQALKQREFGAWRDEEESLGIAASPDFFELEREGAGSRNPWRAPASRRRDLAAAVTERRAQEAAAVEALLQAVDQSEEQALPLLRDSLLGSLPIVFRQADSGSFVGLALDDDRFVYATHSSGRVEKLDRNGGVVGSLPLDDGPNLNHPYGVATDAQGSVYVATQDDAKIHKFDLDGRWLATWGGSGELQKPWGITVTADGSVYVVDFSAHRVQKFDSNGVLQPEGSWGGEGGGEGEFRHPTAIASDSSGNIYVLDGGNRRIQKFDGSGAYLATWQGPTDEFLAPGGIAVGGDGDVYVTELSRQKLYKLDVNCILLESWSAGPRLLPSLGIAAGSDGSIYYTSSDAEVCRSYFGKPETTARWVFSNLLIDPRVGATQKTTRLGHAVGTLQRLVREARQHPVGTRRLSLEAEEEFDELWKWMGAYGMWRAGTFAYFYPDVLLYPSFRREEDRSWGFSKLLQGMGSGGLLAGRPLEGVIDDFEDYLDDVTNLVLTDGSWLQASNLGEGFLALAVRTDSDLGSKLYWRFVPTPLGEQAVEGAHEPAGNHAGGPCSWQPVEGLAKVWRILYLLPSGSAAVVTAEATGYTLHRLQFSTDTLTWEDTARAVDDADIFVLAHLEAGPDGSLWAAETPSPDHYQIVQYSMEEDASLVRLGARRCVQCRLRYVVGVLGVPWDNERIVANVFDVSAARNRVAILKLASLGSEFVWMPDTDLDLVGSGDGNAYVCQSVLKGPLNRYEALVFYPSASGGQQAMKLTVSDALWSAEGPHSVDLGAGQHVPRASVKHGEDWATLWTTAWGARVVNTARVIRVDSTAGVIDAPELRRPLSPWFTKRPRVKEELDPTTLSQRHLRATLEFGASTGGTELYVEECYYHAPMAAGRQLVRSGNYREALNWYRLVYNYPVAPAQRKIYPPLEWEVEAGAAPGTEGSEWLLDPLNPHQVAKTRQGAFTRFTILSIVECLVEMAEAEYTTDTAESLRKAAELYQTALELLEADEFQLPRVEGGAEAALVARSGSRSGDGLETLGESLARRSELSSSLGWDAWPSMGWDAWPSIGRSGTRSVADVAAAASAAPRSALRLGQVDFKMPVNPVWMALWVRAALRAQYLRDGRDIAGMRREVEPYSTTVDPGMGGPVLAAVLGASRSVAGEAPRIPSTPYRYSALMRRSKELAQLAEAMEERMLAALQAAQRAAYDELKARQDAQLARGSVRVKQLTVQSANRGVTIAELQGQRVAAIRAEYQEWIDEGLNGWEQAMLAAYVGGAGARVVQAWAETPWNEVAASARSLAAVFDATAQVASVYAARERRKQEWELQVLIADHDKLIADEQLAQAQDQVQLAEQEERLANVRAEHAETVSDFLANGFVSADLYDWMSGVLESVYRYFLQQAASTARLAEHQLAFERQDLPAGIVQADYWQAPQQVGATSPESEDRRGLTGSARLMRDIYRVDEERFATQKRKLQVVKRLSLWQHAPEQLQALRASGVCQISISTESLDREFPGQYLRLIRRVRVAVAALVPAAVGIRATLTRVGSTDAGTTCQPTHVPSSGDSIALTGSGTEEGLTNLSTEDDLLLPFEGEGVAGSWRLSMPKAANAFDYSTIADVFLTIEYTALSSQEVRAQVVKVLDPHVMLNRAMSFRQELPDQWYHLTNGTDDDGVVTVSFTTERTWYPPNLSSLTIDRVSLLFLCDERAPVAIDRFHFFEGDQETPAGGAASSPDGRFASDGTAPSWAPMTGRIPVGRWELSLAHAQLKRIRSGKIEDIVFVLGFSGEVPAWPA